MTLIASARNAFCALSLASAAMLAVPGTATARGASYVMIMPGSGGQVSTMNGGSDDYARARSLRAGDAGLLYFRDRRGAFVVRDAALMARAAAIVAPQQALGAQQGALGAEQGKLGARQGALGAEQARAAAERSGDWAARQADLGRQQAALGREQAALGTRQAALGRQQADLARKVEGQFKALIDDAIRRGLAERVR